MKILTYNIWDSPAGMPDREAQIRNTLSAMQADVLCLQEVPDSRTLNAISSACGCSNACFHQKAGVAVLTNLCISVRWFHAYAAAAVIRSETHTVQIVSVHLPWKNAAERENAIVQILRQTVQTPAAYTILAGDFNCSDTSDVHRFLTGDCSLAGNDAYCFDLALSRQARTGEVPAATLDFRHNPRWGVYEPENTIELPVRFDRIYLANPYPAVLPVLKNFGTFGTVISTETGLCPSDHYGVYADLQF